MKIECRDLVKTYKTVQAMDGLTLKVPEGQILGLLGKNGQGKSTLIKTLAGVIRPDSGAVILDGQIPGTATKARVSWLPELSGLDLSWSVRQTLNFWQDFFPDFNRSRADEMLKQLNLVPDMRLREMSKGMREKLQLVLVMARDADLYLLDEPMAGVDPVTREEILDTILTGYRPGSTMILSTHLVSDVERILDRVAFIDQGQVILDWICGMTGMALGLKRHGSRLGMSVLWGVLLYVAVIVIQVLLALMVAGPDGMVSQDTMELSVFMTMMKTLVAGYGMMDLLLILLGSFVYSRGFDLE